MELLGKVALVTGASGGIGSEIAIELSKAGAIIALNYNKNYERALEVLEKIKKNGGSAMLVKGDISIYSIANAVIKEVVEKLGKIDILINNAGISKVGLFCDMKEEDFDEIINTNLKGTFNCSHSALQYMLREKKGCLVNISSMWGQVGASCEVVYSASKGGIDAFTKALSKEVAPSNIRVNAISPGVIDTEMNKFLNEEEREMLKEDIPLGKFGEGKDIGRLVVFLASDASKYITGQIIRVDGGMI